jgi:hypothetical protein
VGDEDGRSEDGRSEDETHRDLYAAIESHPGMMARRAWDSLRLVHLAFLGNQTELSAMVAAIESNRDDIGITMASNMPWAAERRQALYAELFRHLHNYVTSAVTLIDHTRNLINGYEGTPIFSEYRERIAAIRDAGLGPFVAKLRVYVVHVGVPSIGTQVQIDDGNRMTITAFIGRDRALEWPDWPADARTYLRRQPEQVSVREVVTNYGEVVERLYRWFYDQFQVLHSDDISAVNDLIRQTPGGGQAPEPPQ